jgi:hypothetical protein
MVNSGADQKQTRQQSFGKETAEMPPKGKGNKVGKTVLTTPTEIETPSETTRSVYTPVLKIKSYRHEVVTPLSITVV